MIVTNWGQLDMFGAPTEPPRRRVDVDPISAETKASIKPAVASMRQQILDHIRAHLGGATCDDVERDLGFKHQTASARMRELKLSGDLVHVDGDRRRTRGGSWAKVWGAPENRKYREQKMEVTT